MIETISDASTRLRSTGRFLGVCLVLLAAFGVATAHAEGEGAITGQIFDAESGAAVAGVTVILQWPTVSEGEPARQEVASTDFGGSFEFTSVPPGAYTVSFIKSGYRASAMKNVEVQAGAVKRADFPLPRISATTTESVLDLDAFVVDATVAGEMMNALELRMDSDALLNVMSAEDFAKFAASDVGDALTRVAGVNVVGGQFAVIRGLEDRYSSTLFNGAVIPSPDPERQSPQLDLFPSKVVSNLEVSKTFLPALPGNSGAGSMNILTTQYPDQFEIKADMAIRLNDNALDSFLRLRPGNPVGQEKSGRDAVGGEFGLSIGGRYEQFEREIRWKAIGAWRSDYTTSFGWQEGREPQQGRSVRPGPYFLNSTGDLALGRLSLSDGRFDLQRSDHALQWVGFGGLGIDLDEDADHKVDLSVFYIDKHEEQVEERSNGYFPGFDYSPLVANGIDLDGGEFGRVATQGSWIDNPERDSFPTTQVRGPMWFANMNRSTSVERDRSLLVTQLNGDHEFDSLDGLEVTWAANYARTTQTDTAYAANYWYEPCGWSNSFQCPAGVTRVDIPEVFPATKGALGYGSYFASGVSGGFLFSDVAVEENQGFGRVDLAYERDLWDGLVGNFSMGGWYEWAGRQVDSIFMDPEQAVTGLVNYPPPSIAPFTDIELGDYIFGANGLPRGPDGGFANVAEAEIEQTRRIGAFHAGAKLTFLDDWDLLGGLRLESIGLETSGAPFRDDRFLEPDGTRQLFPSKYMFLDRFDRPASGSDPGDGRASAPAAGVVFNDQILNIPVNPDFSTTLCDAPAPAAPRGCVDLPNEAAIVDALTNDLSELKVLPSAGITYRPFDWWTIRTAYSETVARPSFRELGYYATVESGNDEVIVGNPYLGVSDVRSVDGRFEFLFEQGDMFAVSGFWKTIDDPIEAILVGSPLGRPTIARTFFNNPNQASLWGLEIEFQKNLGFLGWDFLDYFSIGGNGTYIDASVRRPEAELARYPNFFAVNSRDADNVRFTGLATERRLFGQPEWIANANLTFDQPDWGSRLTLAVYAISDVLESAGATKVDANGNPLTSTIDRYWASFHQVDLIASQTLWRGVSVKFRAKNLTDSTRGRFYDPNQTSEMIYERQFKQGRSYKLTLTYLF